MSTIPQEFELAEIGAPQNFTRPTRRGRRFVKEYYVYSVNFTNLLEAGTGSEKDTQSINFQADSAFFIQKMTSQVVGKSVTPAAVAYVEQTPTTLILPPVAIQAKSTGNAREFFDTPVFLNTITGSGQLPYILPVQKIIASNSTLQVTAENFHAANRYNIQLNFIGYKLYPLGN